MSDVRSLLERSAERVRPRDDAFERLTGRRRRRHRNRRITAGVVALLVAAGGTSGLILSFRDSDLPATGSLDPASFHALWPEQTLRRALDTQARVDAGDDVTAWRLDARDTLERFARSVLRWPEPLVELDDRAADTRIGPIIARVRDCPGGIVLCSRPPTISVVLDRLTRNDPSGIWSVVAVSSEGLSLPLQAGAVVRAGDIVAVRAELPPETRASVGWAYIGECGGVSSYGPRTPVRGAIEFAVATRGFSEECEGGEEGAGTTGQDLSQPVNGYILAFVVANLESAFDPFARVPEAQQEVLAFAAVPVRFMPAPSPGSITDPSTDCEPPPFRPTYLPWLEPGEPLPDPDVDALKSILSWTIEGGDSPASTRVSVGTFDTLPIEFDPAFPIVEVRERDGQMVWVGDPGVGELAVVWTEGRGPCSSHGVYLLAPGMSQARAEAEIRLIAYSLLEPGEPEPYPRGAFSSCPDPEGALPAGPEFGSDAEQVALQFSEAYASGDLARVDALTDPSVRGELYGPQVAGQPGSVRVQESGAAWADVLVGFGCGPEVAAKSWRVAIYNDVPVNASLDWLYLIRRAGGWKVWGSY